MTHFAVLVKITDEDIAKHGDMNSALTALLAPYQENNMGDCPKQFLEFNETETEAAEQYATGTTTRILTPTGELVSRYDERFRVGGIDGIGFGSGTHKVPDDHIEKEIPNKELWATFEAFMADYHGSARRDPEKGLYGYWENPNKKWDYWCIGGRWSGSLLAKPGAKAEKAARGWDSPDEDEGGNDAVRRNDLDFDAIAQKTRAKQTEFWQKWRKFIGSRGTEGNDHFDGPRDMALRIGLLHVRQGPALPEDGDRVIPWSAYVKPEDNRASWNDVYSAITEEEFMRDYAMHFNPIKAYAHLCAAHGWVEPGKMGWWACSDETPETAKKFADAFMEWLREGEGNPWLVYVDCHI